MKTLMKFYSNGDLEILEANKLKLGASGFSFNNNLMSIPSIIEYRSGKTMPNWYRYTEAPISFFKEGIVIKGKLKLNVFEDKFDREDSSSIGNDWIIYSGSFSIKNNMLENSSLNLVSKAVVDTEVHDYFRVELGVFIPKKTEGIMFRGKDNNNHLQVIYENSKIEIAKRINSVKTVVSYLDFPLILNKSYRLSVEVKGTIIGVYIDDNLVLSAVINELLDGNKHGIIAYSDAGSGKIDDFKISIL